MALATAPAVLTASPRRSSLGVARLRGEFIFGAEDGPGPHRGIDLRELLAALLANWSRGGAARGASTITQQLAKNLFLSRDKQFGRKL